MRLGVGILLMEFVVVHSGLMMAGIMHDKNGISSLVTSIVLMGLFYGIFVVAISVAFKSRALFFSFLSIIAGRFIAYGISQGTANQFVIMQSGMSMGVYLLAVIISVIGLPRLGITAPIATDLMKGSGSGLWVEQPHRAIGAGAFYFFILGCANIFVLSWIDIRTIERLFTGQ